LAWRLPFSLDQARWDLGRLASPTPGRKDTMHRLFGVVAATVVVAALLLPASANAQATVSAGEVVIQPDGQTLNVTLSVTCDPGSSIFGTFATLIGRQGNSLFQASLSGFPSPATACTGSPQPLALTGFVFPGPVPVKNGKGTVTNGVLGLNTPSGFVIENYGPLDVKIRKK
jgi:hypothetical protein